MSGNENLKQANTYHRVGSLLFNLSLAIAVGALGYLLVRWVFPDLLPGEALSNEELKRYVMIVFLTAGPMNLLSYIPLNRAKRIYSHHEIDRAKEMLARGDTPEKFNYDAFVANRSSRSEAVPAVEVKEVEKLVYLPDEAAVAEVPDEIIEAVNEPEVKVETTPRKEIEFTAPPSRTLGARDYISLTATMPTSAEIDEKAKSETSEAQARLEALKERMNRV